MGQAASPSLYDFAGGDPVNSFDSDGRCPSNSNNPQNPGGPTANNVFNFNGPINGGQNPDDPQVAQQNVYITESGSVIPLTPGSLTLSQIMNLQMDPLDAATVLRLLGLDYQQFGLENIQINAARLALYANQGSSQLAQVRAIGFLSYAANLFAGFFVPSGTGGASEGEALNLGVQESENSPGMLRPPNRGFVTDQGGPATVLPGQLVDRYGGTGGSFLSPAGTPISQRSLAPGSEFRPLNTYQVLQPFEASAGSVAPFYGQTGQGLQFDVSPSTVQDLIDSGTLSPVPVSAPVSAPVAAPTQ
jgi:hypothetical protein